MSVIWVVMGTRPEVVKLAPVVTALRRRLPTYQTRVIVTGQHRELLDQMLEHFDLAATRDLDLMQPNQSLERLTARILEKMAPALREEAPALVVVQGDTTTTFASALAAFYEGIPVAHVEAGLRSGKPRSPFPEEMNRRLTSALATLHFAPTPRARDRLLAEGIPEAHCHLTGNTVVDAFLSTAGRSAPPPEPLRMPPAPGPMILTTLHRRENFGAPLSAALEALVEIVEAVRDAWILFPVHPNPHVRGQVMERLNHPRIRLCEPLDYPQFCQVLCAATLAISDSGGVQEEAPSAETPVLVVREETERPEAVEAGWARLVGTRRDRIVEAALAILADPTGAVEGALPNPFGDGRAGERIADHVAAFLGVD